MKNYFSPPVITVWCLIVLLVGTSRLDAVQIYNFESLADGNLVGQDNWFMPDGHVSPLVGAGTGYDTSKVGMYGGAGVLPAYRPNDGNFSFSAFDNSATAAYIQFDARHADLEANSTERYYVTYSNGLGVYSTSPWVGLRGGSFELRGCNGGTVTTDSLAPGIDVGDWVRLRLVMDFTDTSGGRTGSMDAYYMNLTDGQTSFNAIGALQDIDMQMSRNQSLPSTWNALAVRLDISTGTGRQFDNLTVGDLSAVPEPSTWALLVAGMVIIGGPQRRRRA
jgi:hypothetical protein